MSSWSLYKKSSVAPTASQITATRATIKRIPAVYMTQGGKIGSGGRYERRRRRYRPPSISCRNGSAEWRVQNRSAPDIFCRVTLMRADRLEGLLASPAWHWRRGIEETPTGRSLPVATREYFDAFFCHIMPIRSISLSTVDQHWYLRL